MEKDPDVLFIYVDSPHEVHQKWGEAIDADFMSIEQGIRGFLSLKSYTLLKYDVVLCENADSMRLAAFVKTILGDFKLIRLVADGSYFRDSDNFREDGLALKGEAWASTKVDGAIAISDWIKSYAEDYIDAEIKVVNPFILEDKYELFSDLEYTPSTNNILFIGFHNGDIKNRKGVDFILRAFKELRKKGYNIEVNIVGNIGEKNIFPEGMTDQGFVPDEDLKGLIEDAELFLQPSRNDAFSVAPLEAMCSGTPAIVSENTGAKEVIDELNSDLICKPNRDSLASKIEYFLNLEDERKKALSEKCREISNDYSEEVKVAEFRRKFIDLIT